MTLLYYFRPRRESWRKEGSHKQCQVLQDVCTDGYHRHISTAHAEIWADYQEPETKDEKDQLLKIRSAFVNSLNAHLESSPHIRIIVNAPIIKTVVGEIMFHPDDVDSVTRESALNLFKKL